MRLARGLAEALVAGHWRVDDLIDRAGCALGGRRRWLRPLVHRLVSAIGPGPRPRAAEVAAFLLADAGFLRACRRNTLALKYGACLPPVMSPAPGGPLAWPVPPLATPGELAALLDLDPGELDWFADVQGRQRRVAAGPLRHYLYRWQAKPSGSARLIEAPKRRLKSIQRRLLDEVLAPIPPHDAAHGFRPGRSVRTYVEAHVGRRVVLKLDLRDFFPAITAARVQALYRTAGYPEAVARVLTGLCTNGVPTSVWEDQACPIRGEEDRRLRRLYQRPHLPQGAPTSPALANLCTYRLDLRLAGLAASAGARYTRYADDLAFSGGRELERGISRFHVHACAIALEEGFVVQTRKTRVMRQGVRQQVAGVVLNEHPNVARHDYDRLKAILHNCVRDGPQGQRGDDRGDFRAHLAGRIAHVGSLNPERGRRLKALFDRIAW
jgi:hypothetical protein